MIMPAISDSQKFQFSDESRLELKTAQDIDMLSVVLLLDDEILFQQVYSLDNQFPRQNSSFQIEGKSGYISIWGRAPGQVSIDVVLGNVCVLHRD